MMARAGAAGPVLLAEPAPIAPRRPLGRVPAMPGPRRSAPLYTAAGVCSTIDVR